MAADDDALPEEAQKPQDPADKSATNAVEPSTKTTLEPSTKTTLKFYHALGFSGISSPAVQGRKLVEHISDDSFVYLTGKHVAVYTYETQKSHRFILKNPKTSRVLAFCVSSNKRYIALSEALYPEPNGGIQVSVYNFSTASKVRELGRGRFQSSPEGSQPPVVSMDFSRDNKYLATVTDPPNPYIYLWQLDKQRLAGMTEVHQKVGQVSISPWAHWELCTTGTSMLKLWRAQGNQLKCCDPLPREKTDSYRFICHQWFDSEKLVVGTAEGDLLIIENQELRRVVPTIFGPGKGVHCLAPACKGFLAGSDDRTMCLFERTYDTEYFKCFKTMQAPDKIGTGKLKVLDLSINPEEDSAIVFYSNNEIGQVNLTTIETLGDNDRVDKHNVFKRLPIGFHSDNVTALDVCVQRSVVVTASTDKHIRVWNFLKKQVEVDKKMDDVLGEVQSVAIHPSGSLLVAGYQTKLFVFLVLANDLQVCHEFPHIRQCKEVRFSKGGQYFAAIGYPWSRILVINSYTFQPLGCKDSPNGVPLAGHSLPVESICWAHNDQSLISAGSDGSVYEWKINNNGGKKNEDNESVIKSMNYHCIRYDDSCQMLAALGSLKTNPSDRADAAEYEVALRTIRFTQEHPPKAPQRVLNNPLKIPTSAQVASKSHRQTSRAIKASQVALSPLAKTLFVGTSAGQLLLYEWPPSDEKETPEPYTKLEVHQGEVAFVVLSHDEKHLFTVGAEDRCMFMFDVDITADGRPISRKPYPYAAFESVAYISQLEFDDRTRLMTELASHNEELQRRQQAEIQGLKEENQLELKQLEDEAADELRRMRHAMEESVQDAEDAKQQATQLETAATEAHMKTAEELEALHTKRIEEMEMRQRNLQEEKDDLVVRYENKLHKLRVEIHNERKQEDAMRKELEQTLSKEAENLRKEIKEAKRAIDGMIDESIYDYILELDGGDRESIEGLHEKWKQILDDRDIKCANAKTNTALFKTKGEKHEREIEQLEAKITASKEQERQLQIKAQEHMTTNDKLKLEIGQRNDTISASEKRILELKKETQELEKLRYVLTFKFGELRKEVAPKEEKIKEMNESIQEMDLELERIGIERDNLEQLLVEKDSRIASLMATLGKQNTLLDDKQRGTDQLIWELSNMIGMDNEDVNEQLHALVGRYSIRYEEEIGASQEKEKAAEFTRQRQYLEGQLSSIDNNNRAKESLLRHDNQAKTEENAMLVKEINVMRMEKKQLQQRLQQADSQHKELQAQLARVANTKDGRAAARPFSAPAPSTTKVRGPTAVNIEREKELAAKRARGRGPVKGRLIRGSTRSLKDLSDMNPQKLAEIVSQVERTNTYIRRQADEVTRLKAYVRELLEGAESGGTGSRPQTAPGGGLPRVNR
eukprot:TRINITY_DN3956_c0_g6_i1.p1 TRINITY_DN3956_c0_g6~~TRINITY_DN3956_c0_g6_i1.p1  ORF type:complete len:1383 (+),score=561.76 TRINITY_DN3956_c0_g6_i1:69-4217(+)